MFVAYGTGSGGTDGVIATSNDHGASWSTVGTITGLGGAARGPYAAFGKLFLFDVNSTGNVWSSPTCAVWTNSAGAISTTFALKDVAVLNSGVMVAVGQGRSTWTSTDGSTWTEHTNALPTNQTYSLMTSNGTTLVAISGGSAYTSTDGVTWSTLHAIGDTRAWKSLIWDGTYFILGASNINDAVFRSTDGVTWGTVSTSGYSAPFCGLAADGTGNVIVTAYGYSNVLKSTDHGANWSDAASVASAGNWTHSACDGANFVSVRLTAGYAVAYGSISSIMSGGAWSATALPSGAGETWNTITGPIAFFPVECAGTSTGGSTATGFPPDPAGQTGTITGSSTTAATSSVVHVRSPNIAGVATAEAVNPYCLAVFTEAGVATTAFVGDLFIVTNALTGALPPITAAITGIVSGAGVLSASLPRLTTSMVGGQYGVAMTLPVITTSMTGVAVEPATITAVLPRITASITGVNTIPGSLAAVLPRMGANFSALAGDVMSIAVTFPAITGSFTGEAGAIGTIAVVLPSITANLSGTQTLFGTIGMRLPALQARLRAQPVVNQLLTLVINTITNAPVMYEQYPYNSYTQFADMYLAAGPDGLRRLDVGTSDTGAPIAAHLSTGEIMFGSEFIKRISDFYAGMRSAGDIKITVTVDEQNSYEYLLSPYDIAQLKQRRTWFGKGARGKYFQFRFDNTDGADFDFDTMNVAAVATARRI